MQLKYVGDLPIVSKNGVGFDHTQPDKYNFIQAAVELLEALNYGVTTTTEHLYKAKDREVSAPVLLDLVKKYVKNIDDYFDTCDKKAHELIHDLVNRVKANTTLDGDERTAWLENIKLMRAYYYQYVINQSAYEAALDALGDEIDDSRVQEVTVPMFKNYGVVLKDLSDVLEKRKSAIDSKLEISTVNEELQFTMKFFHR